MMYEGIWVVIHALSRDHGIQLVHHGHQQVQLVSWPLQVNEYKLAHHKLANLHNAAYITPWQILL